MSDNIYPPIPSSLVLRRKEAGSSSEDESNYHEITSLPQIQEIADFILESLKVAHSNGFIIQCSIEKGMVETTKHGDTIDSWDFSGDLDIRIFVSHRRA